jgi:hypothetical protein
MRAKYALLIAVVLWGGTVPPLSTAASSGVRSLAGVAALQVVVEDFNSATQKIGLQKDQLQTTTESYLTQHGVKVVHGAGGVPVVYVRLSSVIGGDQAHAPISFYLTVQVKQFARLTHAPGATPASSSSEEPPLLVSTWEDGTMAMLDRSELGFYVNQILTNLLGELMQDYQEANK